MQIRLDGIIEDKNQEKIKGTCKPGKISVQEIYRFLSMFGCEPILFMGQIHQLWWKDCKNTRDAKSNHDRKNTQADNNGKERRLRLPAVRHTPSVEMGSYHGRQLMVVMRKMDGRVECQQGENELGQS